MNCQRGINLYAVTKRSLRFCKDYALICSMLLGIGAYFLYHSMPGHERWTHLAEQTLQWLQPTLIALMLFVTFCKVRVHELRLRTWHLWALLVQILFFAICLVVAMSVDDLNVSVLAQSVMLCCICPTATAAAVITMRLGGDATSLVSYTVLSNFSAAILLPCSISLLHQEQNFVGLWDVFVIMLFRVFPLLIFPLLGAGVLRYFLPKWSRWIEKKHNTSFYLWIVALSLAMVSSVRSFMHTEVSAFCLIGIAFVSLVACLLQFWLGRRIGACFGERICGGQALGQKNTVFIIWVGYTFLTPVTALAGGFYSIWHNTVNSWQLLRARRR